MERPKIEKKPIEREVTGEIVYLDEMRHRAEFPKDYCNNLPETTREMFDQEADMHRQLGSRPEIMDLYDEYDERLSDTEASCIALADELLALKDPKDTLTFVDICVDMPAPDVLNKVKNSKAGELLAADDAQMAIESNGEYYPILDMRKESAKLLGASLRVWGWNNERWSFTNTDDEERDPPRDLLAFPSDEKLTQRQLEIAFTYQSQSDTKDTFTESVSLVVNNAGGSSIDSNVSSMAYAETGYEGHGGDTAYDISDDDIAVFGDLVAEIVGDVPESIGMRQDRRLRELSDNAANDEARRAIQELIDATWPAQATYLLSRRPEGGKQNIATMLLSAETADAAIQAVYDTIRRFKNGQ